MKHLLPFAASAAVLLAGPAAAQSLLLTSQTPPRNAAAVPYAAPVALTFSQPLSASPASLGAVRVFGSQRGGRLAGTASVSGNVLTFAPTRNFRPGEQVAISLSTAAQSSTGLPLSRPYVSQFTVAAVGGSGLFGGGSDPNTGVSSRKIITGDVDGDGDSDLLTADWPSGGGGAVTVRLNNGLGVFTTVSSFTLTDSPNGLVLADVDADGDLDLVTTLSNSGVLIVRLNNGSGQFSGGSTTQVLDFLSAVAPADVDGDGDLDLLIACTNGVGTVAVCINNGSGTFTHSFPDVAVGGSVSNCGPVDVAVTDLDADGSLDFVTANSFTNTFSVALNNGSGFFRLASTGNVGTGTLHPRRVVLGDINGDGNPDLITVNTAYQAGPLSVRLGTGTGQFGGSTELTGGLPFDLTLADIDGDSDLDLLTANNQNTGLVTVQRNNGSGTFGPGTDVAVGSYPISLATTDVDGDGDLDLLTVNNSYNSTANIRLNGGSAAPLATAQPATTTLGLYPNPAHGGAATLTGAVPGTQVTVLDGLGRLIASAPANAIGTATLVLPAELPTGLYVVRSGQQALHLTVE